MTPTLPSGVWLVVLAFAAFRATRLFTHDALTKGWRDLLYRWAWDDENPIATTGDDGEEVWVPTGRGRTREWWWKLWTCPWCLGVWASAALYAIWRWADTPGRVLVVILGVAGAQGFLAATTERIES